MRPPRPADFRQLPQISNRTRMLFFKKITQQPSGCWEWSAEVLRSGYGYICIGRRRYRAHRASYLIFHGIDPLDLCVLHKCDNRICVNPLHLRLGTRQENTQDAVAKGRNRGKLTIPQVRAIRQLNTVRTQEELALEFGVSVSSIDRVVRRETWADL